MKGIKKFRIPEELKMIEGSQQDDDQIKRLIANKQMDEDGGKI